MKFKIRSRIKKIIFGTPISGESMRTTYKVHTVQPEEQLSYNDWMNEFKASIRVPKTR
jgi:hypothetical protein